MNLTHHDATRAVERSQSKVARDHTIPDIDAKAAAAVALVRTLDTYWGDEARDVLALALSYLDTKG